MNSSETVRAAEGKAGARQGSAAELSHIPAKVEQAEMLTKPDWRRVRAGSPTTRFHEIKQTLREGNLPTGS